MDKPKYLEIAEMHLGLQEVRDAKILNQFLHQYAGWNFNVATTPWCAAFVNACLGEAGIKGTGSFMARSFLKWGKPVDVPMVGDIVVFSRSGAGTGSGHVAFFMNEIDKHFINVLGGNQSNMVCEKPYNKLTVLGYRRLS